MIDTLPFPIPFSRAQWGRIRCGSNVSNKAYARFKKKCADDMNESGRSLIWVGLLCTIVADAELSDGVTEQTPECSQTSVAGILDESRLIKTLKICLGCPRPSELLPSPAAMFEFFTAATEYVGHAAEYIEATSELMTLVEEVSLTASAAFVASIDVEHGIISRKAWQFNL